jgi:hypothetical protein
MENPVRVALAEILEEDKTLMGLVKGVFFKERDKDVGFPIVIFHKSSGVPTWAFDGPPMDRDVWLVKGVGPRIQAEGIDKRVKEVLRNATLHIEGKAHQDIRQMSDVDFDEIVDGERVDHVGAEFRIYSEDNN